MSIHDRSGLDDFNPMFDSPPTKAREQSSHGNGFGSTSGFSDFTQSSTQNTQPATATSTVNDNSDWDAIFAGLDAPTTEVPKVEPTQTLSNGKTAEAERPVVGRALTEAGVHDDPILKNLTGMGYPRGDALAALEKYDYNLERVSDAFPSK